MRLSPVYGLGVFMSLGSVMSAHAGSPLPPQGLAEGIYELHNHDAGVARPPGYGLRLDELIDVTGDHDIFTFDFDHELSDIRIHVTDDAISIFGTVYGGLNEGNDYAGQYVGLWQVEFSYSNYIFSPGDDDRQTIGPAPDDHYGGISQMFGDESFFHLQDEAGSNPYSFRLGDEDDDDGHRGHDGISGWGWLNHAPAADGFDPLSQIFPHNYESDWLFTVGGRVDDVPEPGTAAILGLAGIALLRRRR